MQNWKIIPAALVSSECPTASKRQRGGWVSALDNSVFVYRTCARARSPKMPLYFLGTIIQGVFELLKERLGQHRAWVSL